MLMSDTFFLKYEGVQIDKLTPPPPPPPYKLPSKSPALLGLSIAGLTSFYGKDYHKVFLSRKSNY